MIIGVFQSKMLHGKMSFENEYLQRKWRLSTACVRAKAELFWAGVFQPAQKAGAGDRPEGARPKKNDFIGLRCPSSGCHSRF